MESLLPKEKEKKGINKVFLIGIAVGIALIAAVIWLFSMQPTMREQQAKLLEGFHLEGTPEFAQSTKDIVISTDFDRTTESPTGLGTIQMNIVGRIRNKGAKTFNGLEVNVGVVDRQNKVLREKRVIVVPSQYTALEPQQIALVTVTLDGFPPGEERADIRWKVTAIKTE
jgi:hypothetical protein